MGYSLPCFFEKCCSDSISLSCNGLATNNYMVLNIENHVCVFKVNNYKYSKQKSN